MDYKNLYWLLKDGKINVKTLVTGTHLSRSWHHLKTLPKII